MICFPVWQNVVLTSISTPPSDHGLLCSRCTYDHSHSACNIRPVKLVDIVEKWDTAHKNLETLQAQFNVIRSNIENDFHQANFASDCFCSDLKQRFKFFSDITATNIAKALLGIENELKPLHKSNPQAECGFSHFGIFFVLVF